MKSSISICCGVFASGRLLRTSGPFQLLCLNNNLGAIAKHHVLLHSRYMGGISALQLPSHHVANDTYRRVSQLKQQGLKIAAMDLTG